MAKALLPSGMAGILHSLSPGVSADTCAMCVFTYRVLQPLCCCACCEATCKDVLIAGCIHGRGIATPFTGCFPAVDLAVP